MSWIRLDLNRSISALLGFTFRKALLRALRGFRGRVFMRWRGVQGVRVAFIFGKYRGLRVMWFGKGGIMILQ